MFTPNAPNALNALNALTRIYPSLALIRRQSGDAQLLAGLEPGQRVRATVQTSFVNGEFMVALNPSHGQQAGNEHALRMRLPAGIHPGDVLNLIFVSREPQPAFALTADLPTVGVSSLLSETGRFIDSLLHRTIFSASPAASSAASFHFPLLAIPPDDGADLARSLASALGRSGLFYESHLAQWAGGARSLAELLLEPQARLRPAQLSDADTESSATMTIATDATDTGDAFNPVHPSAVALVRQQLEVFEMRHFAWQGEAWPGQAIAWEAAEEALQSREEPGGSDQPSSAGWQTRLHLTLPNLGSITASLRLDMRDPAEMSGVDVRLTAAEPVTAAVLRAGTAPLASGLNVAGIKLLGLGVDLNEEV